MIKTNYVALNVSAQFNGKLVNKFGIDLAY